MNIPGFDAFVMSITPVGSRVTCNPAPTDTDEDYLVLVDADTWLNRFKIFEGGLGFKYGGSEVNILSGNDFDSWRKGEINIIVTSKIEFYYKFLAATSVGKRLNLLDKSDRIALFQAVLYGVIC